MVIIMMFCPKCGSILVPKKESGKYILSCSCGYTNKETEKATLKETIKSKTEIAVVESDFEGKPVVDADCPKCGHSKAYFWMQQTRGSDEPETKFLKCEKCKHIWRDYTVLSFFSVMDIIDYLKKNNSARLIAKPSSPKTEILGFDGSRNGFKVNVKAPPENNRANIEIIKFFRKEYKLDIKIVSGFTSKEKTIKIAKVKK
jgi:DNA-directed RNA polymerase subunit M